MVPVRQLVEDLRAGRVTARQLLESCLAAIDDPDGEGARTYLLVDRERAMATAVAYDAVRSAGGVVPPLAGVPVAVKDLFDVVGQVTTAGSTVLADRPPATVDAVAVARLRAAGCVVVGRTNMTEFAYSGLGLNAHHDTPRSPFDRSTGLIPGGSSSGSAVAVADGMAAGALGTDTGGSCRIPAAFCGITGFKPTARRVPTDGVVPLSFSLDSIGPLAPTVDCCAILDRVLAAEGGPDPLDTLVGQVEPGDLRLGLLSDYVMDDVDPAVAEAHERALARLARAGITVSPAPFPELHELADLNRLGGLIPAEAYAWHRELLRDRGDQYDQRVRTRIEPGADIAAADYVAVLQGRRRLQAAAARRLGRFDAVVFASVAITAPTVESLDHGDPAHYSDRNLKALRNTSVANFLDTCAISLPTGDGPTGLMLMGRPGDDAHLLDVAGTVESALALDSTG